MTRTAIIAAMAGELKPFVRGWQHDRLNGVDLWRRHFDQHEWVAACAGAGVNAATRAFAEVERDGPIDSLISTGWAGALDERFVAGRAYRVSAVVDARTGERFLTAAGPDGPLLVTSPKVANGPEKQRLAATYGSGMVDMEAAFYCIKGISDGYRDQLPDFNRFILPNGRFQLARFIVFCILRPWHWPALVRMGENSRRAAQGIAESLLEVLHQ
jgi:adenosylhomocysteine nucleosidase